MPEEVRSRFLDALGLVGNPASTHGDGQSSLEILEGARERIAATLGAERVEVSLTSGGTESINLAVKGLFWARQLEAPRPVILLPQDGNFLSVGVVKAPYARPERLAFEALFLPTAMDTDGVGTSVFPDALNPALLLNAGTTLQLGFQRPFGQLLSLNRGNRPRRLPFVGTIKLQRLA